MIPFYLITGLFLLVVSGLFLTLPERVRLFVRFILDKEMFIIPGIIEIVIGLGTIYFRSAASMRWFVITIGLMIFFDGIMYLAAPKKIATGYEWFVERDATNYRIYGLILLIVAAGYIAVAFSG